MAPSANRRTNMPAGLKTHQHPEDLRNRATEPASNISLCEPIRLARKKFEHIKTFFQSWRWIAASHFSSCLHVHSESSVAFHRVTITTVPRENQESYSRRCRRKIA